MDMDIVSARELEEKINVVCDEEWGEKVSHGYTRKFEADFVVNSKLNRQFSIVYHGKSLDRKGNSCLIPVKSRREVELLLLSLREEASVRMDAHERKLCNLWDWLYGRTYTDVFTDLKWSYREEDEMVDIIEKIPQPQILSESFLQIHHDDPAPERMDQEYVHKTNKENVLVSQPFQYGNMYYFNGFHKSPEFNIDHSSDHLEGIIIFEAARQAGIAALHLAGAPLSGKIVLLKTNIQYKRFVEFNEPYLINTIPVIRQKGGYLYVVFNILQDGASCATGYLSGLLYKDKDSYIKHRSPKYFAEVSN